MAAYPKISENTSGKVSWQSPSNIAIIKYWGKYGNQLPQNASLSLTLSEAHTKTSVAYTYGEGNVSFRFEGKENDAFRNKIVRFIDKIMDDMPFLQEMDLVIESENTFPHSSGIASSASAMSALAMCFCDIEKAVFGKLEGDAFLKKASHIARLGSGSASRSVYPHFALWGKHVDVSNSDNHYAIMPSDVHPIFKDFHDDILIISAAEKSVSSTAGHALMEGNPFATARYEQAQNRLRQLLICMQEGDIHAFGKIAEDEAMTLHALMMCSDPSYVLMKPDTLTAIERIRAFRERTGSPCYFTLDAGPNIHLLYPHEVSEEINTFIEEELIELCDNGRIIRDRVGPGPQKS